MSLRRLGYLGEHYLQDLIDVKSRVPVADMETGNLVVTALTRKALPLIRFQTAGYTQVILRERKDTPPQSGSFGDFNLKIIIG